jgi:hypothetical protein
MSTVGNDAMIHELREARQQSRGVPLRAVMSLECHNKNCCIRVVRVDFSEDLSRLPMQPHCFCPRCRQPLMFSALDPR